MPLQAVKDAATDQNFRALDSRVQTVEETGGSGEPGPEGPEGPEGPAGPKGETGTTGEKGATGSTGPEGPKGETGEKGAKGDTGSTGPEGPKGEKGSTGEKGEKGEKGETGAAGKDATVWEAANPIYEEVGRLAEEAAAATYLLGSVVTTTGMIASGTSITIANKHPLVIYFDPADYAISGKTAKLVLRGTVMTNATKPTITFTFSLRPITNAGAEKVFAITAGAEVSGSKAEVKEPSASSFGTAITSAFTMPEKGLFTVAVVTSGKLTAKASVQCAAQLSVVWE